MSTRQLSRPRRMLTLFLGAMTAFTAGTAWLAWRFVQQDRAAQQQQIVERLEIVADLAAAELRQRLAALETGLDALAGSPADLRQAEATAAAADLAPDALLLLQGPQELSAFPVGRLVYRPHVATTGGLPPGTFAEGESHEFVRGDYDRAIDTFRRQAEVRDNAVRAGALLRLARVYRKTKRAEEALTVYQELAGLGDTRVDGLPAELLARYARCALFAGQSRQAELRHESELLRTGLLAGTWSIDRGTFITYMEGAEAFIRLAGDSAGAAGNPSAGKADGLSQEARMSMALAAATEALWVEWSGANGSPLDGQAGVVAEGHGRASRVIDGFETLLLWRRSGDTTVGLVLGPKATSEALFASLQPLAEDRGMAVRLVDAAGRAVREIGSAPVSTWRPKDLADLRPDLQAEAEPEALRGRPPRARRTIAESGLPWELHVSSADPEADRARLTARRRLLTIVLASVVLLICAGTYFSTRAVAQELEMARLQSDFVAAVSHDFRTPLTSLRQVSEALLGDRVAEDRRRDYYEIQRRGIDRLHRLVEGLLDFGRMEAGAQEFSRQTFAARPWVERVVQDFRREVDKQGYTIELSWKADDQTLVGDEAALSRALWNLLDNAVKYSPDCRTVRVEGRTETAPRGKTSSVIRNVELHRFLAVAVRDRGLGVDPEEHLEIFAKFVRGSAALAGSSAGTGLGLAMVEHIVEAHGGHVEVESAPGDGSAFTIYLPVGGSS